jgi:hypothetical protein
MHRRKLVFLVAVMIAGAFGVGGNAWAQAILIPVSGSEVVETADPGVMWTDEDGITHIREMIRTGISTGQDANGIPIASETEYHSNIDINLATGDGDYLGHAVISGCYGDLVGSAQGHIQGTFTAWTFNGTFNYPQASGEWEGYKLRGTFVSVWGSDFTDWEGIIHALPGGGGGDKVALHESCTLSEVKALYR